VTAAPTVAPEAATPRRRLRRPYAVTLIIAVLFAAAAGAVPRYGAYAEELQRADVATFSAIVTDMPVPKGMREDPTMSACIAIGIRCFESMSPHDDAALARVCAALAGLGADMDCASDETPLVRSFLHGRFGRAEVVATSPGALPYIGEQRWRAPTAVAVAVVGDSGDVEPVVPTTAWALPSDLGELRLLPAAWLASPQCVDPAPGGCRKFEWDQSIAADPTAAADRLAQSLDAAGLRVDDVRCKDSGHFCTVVAGGYLAVGGRRAITVAAGFNTTGDGSRLHLVVSAN
jgi:hypothetical protein